MKKIGLFVLYSLLFIAALLFFTPKENLYYFAEEQLKPLGVIIGYEDVIDHGFTLEISHSKLYVQKIKSANIGTIEVSIFGVYNAVDIKNVVLDKTFEQFFPPLIEHIEIYQHGLSPLEVNAHAIGDFGEAQAHVNLSDRNGTVLLTPSKLMTKRYRNTLRQLKKTKEGTYTYVFKF